MRWVFLGYASAIYAAFVLAAVVNLPEHPRPAMGALAYLLLMPFLALCPAAEMFVQGSQEDRQRITQAIAQGLMRRSWALSVGAIGGAVGIALCGVLFRTDVFGTRSLLALFIGCGLSLLLAPAVACAVVATRAKQALENEAAFPVILRPDAGSDSRGSGGQP